MKYNIIFSASAIFFVIVYNFIPKRLKTISDYKTYLKKNFYSELLKNFGITTWKYSKYAQDSNISPETTCSENNSYCSIQGSDAYKSNSEYIGENCQNSKTNELNSKTVIAEIKRSDLFDNLAYTSFDDEFIGSYNDVEYKVIEARTYTMNDGLSTRQAIVPTFKGIIILFNHYKTTTVSTIVRQKYSKYKVAIKHMAKIYLIVMLIVLLMTFSVGMSLCDGFLSELKFFGQFYIVLTVILLIHCLLTCVTKPENKKLKGVALESVHYKKLFDVYSSDQTEARYVLDTVFMERFYNLKKVFRANDISCSFYGDKLMIAISTDKDAFEIGNLDTSIKDPKCLLQFYKEMNSIREIIDILKVKSTKKLPN